MTREEAINKWVMPSIKNTWNEKKCDEIIKALEQELCVDVISRQAAIEALQEVSEHYTEKGREWHPHVNFMVDAIKGLPPVTPQPKTGYISIDDVMSVFDDFMCGEVDEDGTDTFLKMLKDKVESEDI